MLKTRVIPPRKKARYFTKEKGVLERVIPPRGEWFRVWGLGLRVYTEADAFLINYYGEGLEPTMGP